jgi:hypothetical protein
MRPNKTLPVFLGLTISISSFSQFSAGIEAGMSTSSYSDIERLGTGASLRYERPFQEKLSLTCAVGFLSFTEKVRDGFPTGNKIVPISGGVKYYFSESGKRFYAAADLGLSFISYAGTKDTRLGFSPGIGYRTNRWDFTGRLNAMSQANYYGLRVAYVFKLK